MIARRRSTVLQEIVAYCGDQAKTIDSRDGWPGIVEVAVSSGWQRIALHAGPVTGSGRERPEERRFQNPGKDRPIQNPSDAFPLLIGLWDEGDRRVLVGMDAHRRVGKRTRQSLFMPLSVLQHAESTGWADHHSTSDELIVAFHPSLLSLYVDMRMGQIEISTDLIQKILRASGLLEADDEGVGERARRASTQLVRDAAFRKEVLTAYDEICAMCGLDSGLLTGAHIYPAAAPGSPDEVWNGLALCGNHHLAFDKHLLWVDPGSKRVDAHPRLIEARETNPACARFLDSTRTHLSRPTDRQLRPRADMFVRRYEYFGREYAWAG